ncbi:helix-turn-helix transcriptional regulator [Paraburkholderia kururiensis]|uniref:helix-turn-helix transcriptional regulator n=1 Tax=Paraburkholderia kururiensis TaxID=984307 RepID=UPI000AF96D4C|nr:response regulator transcription factor [Paraburkholderia kururiensis]
MRFAVFNPDAERREGLKALLRQIDRQARFMDVVDWRSADRAVRHCTLDLIVIDWHEGMRLGDVQAFVSAYPRLRLAVVIDRGSPGLARSLIDKGVPGVIPRSMDARLILRALEMVMLGGEYLPADVLKPGAAGGGDRLQRRGSQLSVPPKRARLSGGLSPRQEQIMRCVHMGSTNKMIAKTLGISEGTVKIHLACIFQQLGAPNRAAAVAIYNGWLSSQLQVLSDDAALTPKPVPGEPGPVPLRKRRKPSFSYPLPDDNIAEDLPMAAEPTPPFDASAPNPDEDTKEE